MINQHIVFYLRNCTTRANELGQPCYWEILSVECHCVVYYGAHDPVDLHFWVNHVALNRIFFSFLLKHLTTIYMHLQQ